MIPVGRLSGIRITHVAPGGATVVTPATETSLKSGGHLNVLPTLVSALEAAATTALSPGTVIVPLKIVVDSFRPAHPQPGNLIARARVLNSSRLFVFVESGLEDAEGRHIAHGTFQGAVERLEPPPPPAPDPIPRVEEPVYETPDPYQRAVRHDQTLARIADEAGAASVLRELPPGSPLPMPMSQALGATLMDFKPGEATVRFPSSEWFCLSNATISEQVIATMTELTADAVALGLHLPGQTVLANDELVRFVRPIPTDGRFVVACGRVMEQVRERLHIEVKLCDADGNLAAYYSGTYTMLNEANRPRRNRSSAQRVLATLLFTDAVDSTRHADRLGDAKWRELLNDHRSLVRMEVARQGGTEIDTAGDGFFIRFESPGQAIQAARAASVAVRKLGIELRAGIHTGEC